MSPYEIDYLLGNATGGATRRISRDWEEFKREGLTANMLPFVGGIKTNRHQKRSIGDLYDAHAVLLKRQKLNEADPDAFEFTDEQGAMLEELTDTRAILAAISKATKDLPEKDRIEAARVAVGAARESLGREALESSPSPWKLTKSQFPESLKKKIGDEESVYDSLKRIAINQLEASKPAALDPKKRTYANGNTRAEEYKERQERAKLAKAWLAAHAASPIVKEARIEYVLKQRGKRKLGSFSGL